MSNYNSNQIVPYVYNELANMNIQATPESANCITNTLMPFVNSPFVMMYGSVESMVHQMMVENANQAVQIAKLKQTHEEMPRMFWVNPETGFGCCTDGNKVKMIGKIKIESVYNIISEKNGIEREFYYIVYYDSSDNRRYTVVSPDKLASKNLLKFFEGFVYERRKELANDYLAHCIHYNKHDGNYRFYPEYAGFSFLNKDKAEFYCNDGTDEQEIMKEVSPYFVNKVIPPAPKEVVKVDEIVEKYLKTSEEMFLFTYSVCGLLSSFFDEITCPMEQILVISAHDAVAVRKAVNILQIYNRGTNPVSFDSTKNEVSKELLHSRDETVIINDCSIVDNEKRRVEMLNHILTVNGRKECQPHNLAIISPHVQRHLPDEKKICLTLPDDFAEDMTKAEEKEMCGGLNTLVRVIIDYFINHYSEIRKKFTESLEKEFDEYRVKFGSFASTATWFLISMVYLIIVCGALGFDKEKILGYNIFNFTEKVIKRCIEPSTDITDAVTEEFIDVLNEAIISGKLNIVHHNKKMSFVENTNQLVVKEEYLAMEESTVNDVILPQMRTTNSVCRLLKCLDETKRLHSTNRNRYPTRVYNKGKSKILPFIAVYREILDDDTEQIIQESETLEWFMNQSDNEKHIPIVTNSLGQNAYQLFDTDKDDNMHFFAMGNSGSGKTHCLVERMCTLSKKGSKVIVFDTSHSFTRREIIEKLSAGGDDDTVKKVKKYVNKHITFHIIEQKGVPVDMFRCVEASQSIESKERMIMSIVESHNSGFGARQKAVIHKAVHSMVEEGKADILTLYDKLTGDEVQANLSDQLIDTLSFLENFKCSDKSWGEFLSESKEIVVISTNSVNSSGGSGLIDLLLMSLYFYQQKNNTKQTLSIFIDEIKSQNLAASGPICKLLTECRKDKIGLNFATQYPPKSSETEMIMDNTGTKAFFTLGGRAASAAAKQLRIDAAQLDFLDIGECYIKGSFYNKAQGKCVPTVVHGTTYRNFVKKK